MRSISIAVIMMGVALSAISSCATVPKPLAPGELRLLDMHISESDEVKANIPFVVNFIFEADDVPEIKTACFYFSGNGPHCFKVTSVNYVSPKTIQTEIRTTISGSRRLEGHVARLEGYVAYIRDGKIRYTNVISIYFRVIPQW